MSQLIVKIAIVFTCSLILSTIIVFLRNRLDIYQKKRQDHKAVQAAHTIPVPRLGGVVIIAALILGMVIWFDTKENTTIYSKFLLTLIPIFITGLAEDLGFFISPKLRLFASTISSALFVFIFEQWIKRVDVFGLDIAMQWPLFAICFSIFMAVGISHAFNLIDGLNGLAPFTAMATALALAAIAHDANLILHRDSMILLAVTISGFVLLNFPFGKIFLGDAGAYVIGHILVWIAISVLWNAEAITPWAMLLIFFWPITDTFWAIIRRTMKGKSVSHPDRLHFHQLIMRAIEIVIFGRKNRRISNPLATTIIMPLALCPIFTGVMLRNNYYYSVLSFFTFTLLYIITYYVIIKTVKKNRKL